MAELTSQAREAISKHIWSVLIPTGIGLSVLSFVLGFFINEVARSNAYAEAIGNFASKMQDAARDVGATTARAEAAAVRAETLAGRIDDLNMRLQSLSEVNRETREILGSAQERFSRSEAEMMQMAASQQEALQSNASELRALHDELQEKSQRIGDLEISLGDLYAKLVSSGVIQDKVDSPRESENGSPGGGESGIGNDDPLGDGEGDDPFGKL